MIPRCVIASLEAAVRPSIRRSCSNEKSLEMFDINLKLISFIIDDSRHFIHLKHQLRLGLIKLGIGRISLVIGRIGVNIGLIELGIGLIELGIGLMELGIGLRIDDARRTILTRVSGLVSKFLPTRT